MITATWLTVAQVASLLGVRIETVRRWIRRGELPVLELGSPRTVYRVRRSDLDEFARERFPGKLSSPSDGAASSGDADASAPALTSDADVSEPDTFPPMDLLRKGDEPTSSREMVNAIPVVVFREQHQNPGTTSFLSIEIETILGYTPDDVVGRLGSWTEIIHPDDVARVKQEMARTDASGEPFRMDYRMVHRNGQHVWVRVEAELAESHSEGPVWEGVLFDITEQKRLEELLQRSQRQQRAIADLGQVALEKTTLGPILQFAVTSVAESLDADLAVIWEVLPGGASLVLREASDTQDARALGRSSTSPPSSNLQEPDPLTLYALSSRSPVVSRDLASDDRFATDAFDALPGVSSGLSLVIPGTARAFGVLTVFSVSDERFSSDDVKFAHAIVNILASAVEEAGGQWFTVGDVASLLQVTEETVRRWIRGGDLPALHLGGARAGYRVYPSDLDRFIQHRLGRVRIDR